MDRIPRGVHVDDPETQNVDIDVLLVIGVSGAGRGTVAKVLEDAGWYVADNVPSTLISRMVQVAREGESGASGGEQAGPVGSRLAVVVRTGARNFASELASVRRELREIGVTPKVLFLDASDSALVRRFEQVRRGHPLQGSGTLMQGIAAEREILASVKHQADLVVDTSLLSVQRLREIIEDAFAEDSRLLLNVAVQSFGFKYGLPIDADLVADVRFLPNPHWVPELRPHNGQDADVRDYVLGQVGASEYLDLYARLVGLTADGYQREGKRYMTIGVGCTGGKHRSVAMTEALAERLSRPDPERPYQFAVRVMHRDLGRE
ncbi:RNase adapter RapZ [Jongsikchunia kroppenstedtii]|uniref:RNase adapter RapZ n=1 Tax=Jongsikchunia kroppenstedtii TaxID=1121721 RepID=UPI000687158C|nr:RNase adapter RapZ [Jongsikchunia kroppenstedtii]